MNKSNKPNKYILPTVSTAVGTTLGTGVGYLISKSKAERLARELGIKPGSKEYKDLLKGKITKGMIAGGVGGGLTGLGTGVIIDNWDTKIKATYPNSIIGSTKSSKSSKSKSEFGGGLGTGAIDYNWDSQMKAVNRDSMTSPTKSSKSESQKPKSESKKSNPKNSKEYPVEGDYDFKAVIKEKKKGNIDYHNGKILRKNPVYGGVILTPVGSSVVDEYHKQIKFDEINKDKQLSPKSKEIIKNHYAKIHDKIAKSRSEVDDGPITTVYIPKSKGNIIQPQKIRSTNYIINSIDGKPLDYHNSNLTDDVLKINDEVLRRWNNAVQKYKERTGKIPTLEQEAALFKKINKRYWSQPNQIATQEQRQDYRKWARSKAVTQGRIPSWNSYALEKHINVNANPSKGINPRRRVQMYSDLSTNSIQYTKSFSIALAAAGLAVPSVIAGIRSNRVAKRTAVENGLEPGSEEYKQHVRKNTSFNPFKSAVNAGQRLGQRMRPTQS